MENKRERKKVRNWIVASSNPYKDGKKHGSRNYKVGKKTRFKAHPLVLSKPTKKKRGKKEKQHVDMIKPDATYVRRHHPKRSSHYKGEEEKAKKESERADIG